VTDDGLLEAINDRKTVKRGNSTLNHDCD